jgi:hypothetical protein
VSKFAERAVSEVAEPAVSEMSVQRVSLTFENAVLRCYVTSTALDPAMTRVELYSEVSARR